MPNGRSGGFLMLKPDLARLLDGLSPQSIVGCALTSPVHSRTHTWTDLDAAAVTNVLSAFQGRKVWVEEQDHAYYILHLDRELQGLTDDPEASKWIVVRAESPLFGPLRERHRRQIWFKLAGLGLLVMILLAAALIAVSQLVAAVLVTWAYWFYAGSPTSVKNPWKD
jgi:hypothetical protein